MTKTKTKTKTPPAWRALTLRVPVATARRLEKLAKADHRSMQSLLRVLLDEALGSRDG